MTEEVVEATAAPPGGGELLDLLVSRWEYRERRWLWLGKPGHSGNLFRLTRELRARAALPAPDLLRPHLGPACERLGTTVDEVMAFVLGHWEEVRIRPGEDDRVEAQRLADLEPVPFLMLPYRYRPTAYYHRTAALAYWLEQLNAASSSPRAWFPFGSKRLSEWLGINRDTAGRAIRTLYELGVIRLRLGPDGKPAYRYRAGNCYEARYAGPDPRKGQTALLQWDRKSVP